MCFGGNKHFDLFDFIMDFFLCVCFFLTELAYGEIVLSVATFISRIFLTKKFLFLLMR